jgi:hypothetical protein
LFCKRTFIVLHAQEDNGIVTIARDFFVCE